MDLVVTPLAQACRKALFKQMTTLLIIEYKDDINTYMVRPLVDMINTIKEFVTGIFSGIGYEIDCMAREVATTFNSITIETIKVILYTYLDFSWRSVVAIELVIGIYKNWKPKAEAA